MQWMKQVPRAPRSAREADASRIFTLGPIGSIRQAARDSNRRPSQNVPRTPAVFRPIHGLTVVALSFEPDESTSSVTPAPTPTAPTTKPTIPNVCALFASLSSDLTLLSTLFGHSPPGRLQSLSASNVRRASTA